MLKLLLSIVINVIVVTKVTSLYDCSLIVFPKCLVVVFDLFLVFAIVLCVGQRLKGHKSLGSLFEDVL